MSDSPTVVPFHPNHIRQDPDARFLVCPGCDGQEFGIVVRSAAGRPFVAALVCVTCAGGTEIGVLDGFLV